MYKCEDCKRQVEKNIPQMRAVVETKPIMVERTNEATGEKTSKQVGSQIVKELKVCPECYGKHEETREHEREAENG